MKGTLIIYRGKRPRKVTTEITWDEFPQIGKFFHFEEELTNFSTVRIIAKFRTEFPIMEVLNPTFFTNNLMWVKIVFKTVANVYCLEFQPFDELSKMLTQKNKLQNFILLTKGEANGS